MTAIRRRLQRPERRSGRRAFCFALSALAASAASSLFSKSIAHADAKAPEFRVIVHPKNPTSSAKKGFVTDAFLKKTTRWGDGVAIRPVDQEPNSTVRQKFTRSVLKRSVAAVRHYWQQRIFSGRDVPPPELDSDADVVAYVLKHRGAVGYVSGTAELRGASILAVR